MRQLDEENFSKAELDGVSQPSKHPRLLSTQKKKSIAGSQLSKQSESLSKRWANLESYIQKRKTSKDKNEAYSTATKVLQKRGESICSETGLEGVQEQALLEELGLAEGIKPTEEDRADENHDDISSMNDS